MSTLFLRTLRDDPADAEVPSHKLLVRAGYIRRVGPGIYSWLPLGLEVLSRVERIVREEMNAIGAQEVHFPALIPREYFEASGRWDEYGDNIFRLLDRKKAEYLLAPTHEELFTQLVKGEYSSYKDYPVSLYQIQIKYRDESRPRAGILRGREFIMKDSYSFDLTQEGLEKSYRDHREAYERMFGRMGFDYKIVYAVSGAMGGSASEEFLAPTPSGEDTFVQCTKCDYAANTEAVEVAAPEAKAAPGRPAAHVHPAAHVYDTPNTPTIESLVECVNDLGIRPEPFTAADTLKNVVLRTRAPGHTEWSLLVVGVPGDREVDLKRIEGQLEPVEVEQASPEDLAKVPMLVRGYIGPQMFGEQGGRQMLGDHGVSGIRYVVDPLVAEGTSWITGANVEGRHAVNVVRGRDFSVDDELGAVEIRAGDLCSRCGAPLQIARGIELGHVFQLGQKYAKAFDLKALGPDGKPALVTMGSYGVGVTRAVAALAEQTYDDKGLCWPRSVAPAEVHIVATGKDESVFAAAGSLADELERLGVTVLYDDRWGVSPGVKFKDAELIGVPTIVIVGKGLAAGTVELKDRRTDERQDIPVDGAAEAIKAVTSTPAN